MEINKVFVYGTLMTGMHNHHLIKPFLKSVDTAKTNGFLFDLPYGYPAMIAGEDEVESVQSSQSMYCSGSFSSSVNYHRLVPTFLGPEGFFRPRLSIPEEDIEMVIIQLERILNGLVQVMQRVGRGSFYFSPDLFI